MGPDLNWCAQCGRHDKPYHPYEIKEEDLLVTGWCYRGQPSCQGGQHVAKTCASVLILHKPTGIAVVGDDQRSQLGNKHAALSRLQSILNLVKNA